MLSWSGSGLLLAELKAGEKRMAMTCYWCMLRRVHYHWVREIDFFWRHVSCVGSVRWDHHLVSNLPLSERLAKIRVKSPEQMEMLPQKVIGYNLALGARLKSC